MPCASILYWAKAKPAKDSWWMLLHREELVSELVRNKTHPNETGRKSSVWSWPTRIVADIRCFYLRVVADLARPSAFFGRRDGNFVQDYLSPSHAFHLVRRRLDF